MRDGTVRPDAAVIDLLLQGADALERAIERPGEGASPVILDRLGAYAEVRPTTGRPADVAADRPKEAPDGPAMRVTVRLERDTALPAVRAAMVLRAARQLGEVADVQPPEARIMAGDLDGPFRFLVLGLVDAAALEGAVRA